MPQAFAANASHHCFVSASAGTGKTKVLVDRFVNILKAGYNPESILCLTFTKTAASEMKERVLKILQTDDPFLYKKVLESSLRIQTIHSFCQELLQKHEAFSILEDIDVKRLLQKAKESLYSSNHTSVMLLAKTMSETRFDELLESLIANPSLFLTWKETYGNIENYEKSLRMLLDYDDFDVSLITEELYPFCLTQKGDLRKRIAPEYKNIAAQVYRHRIQRIHKDMAEQTLHFLSVAELVFEAYEKIKKDRQTFDFHDLIHKAKTIPFSDLELSHILIDEAQDTSPDQWEIIFRLSREYIEEKKGHTLFIVGDYKQSIYGFQGANPDIFMHLPIYFSQQLENFHTVSLSLSYRTTSFVLDIVDQTFKNLGTSFDAHESARIPDEGKVVLWPLTKNVKVDYPPWGLIEEGQTFLSTEQMHAKNLGNSIERILSSNMILPSTKAPPRPQDILVLFQKRSTLLNELQKVLEEKNIPSSGRDRLILYDQLIIRDLLALSQFALLEEDDYSLACILKSPFCSVSEEELYLLCTSREGTLWDHLKKIKHDSCTFLQSLIDKRHLPPFSFYASLVQNMTFGDSQVLETFLDYAIAFEEKDVPTLREFLEWFRTSEAYMKRRSKGCVRFMTVHASKGLQAPIVILADSTEKPSLRHDLFLVKDDILLIRPFEETPWIAAVKDHMLSRLQEEHLRLLYVAMTRAQDHLYVTGYEKEGVWYEAIQKTDLTPCFLEKPPCHPELDLRARYQIKSGAMTPSFEVYTEATVSEEQLKGIALHALLENMPHIPKHHEDGELLHRLLRKFPEFFDGNAEMTLATPDGLKRLDRFIEKENETWIIEYKTHLEKPNDLREIIEQVRSYKKYVSQTHKNVRCFLFWVRLEEIEEII